MHIAAAAAAQRSRVCNASNNIEVCPGLSVQISLQLALARTLFVLLLLSIANAILGLMLLLLKHWDTAEQCIIFALTTFK